MSLVVACGVVPVVMMTSQLAAGVDDEDSGVEIAGVESVSE